MVKAVSAGKMDEFKRDLTGVARQIVFWAIPVTFLFIVLRAQIVRVILGSGYFSWGNTRLVAASLAIFSVSVLAQAMIALLSRAYYATGNTKRPLAINIFSSILIVVSAYLLLNFYQNIPTFRYFFESLLKVSDIPGTEILMLPLAYSLGTLFNFFLEWYYIKKDFMRGEIFIAKTFFQSLGASFFIGAVAYFFLNVFAAILGTDTFVGVFLQGFVSGILGISAGAVVLYFLRSEEFAIVLRTLKTKFWRARPVPPLQEEL